MPDFTISLTTEQETGWAAALAKINAVRVANRVAELTVNQFMEEQIQNFGDQQFVIDQKSKKSFTEVNTEDEAVAVLRARGYTIQEKRG